MKLPSALSPSFIISLVIFPLIGVFISSIVSVFSVGLLPNDAKAAALTSVSFGVSGVCANGASCTPTYWQINFTTTESIPNDGKIRITFPAGFNVSGATFNSWSGFDGTRTVSIEGQTVIVMRNGDGTASAAGSKWIRLSNIVNPSDGGIYNGSVETTESDDTTLDGPTNSSNITIYELDSISVIPGTLKTGEETTYKINFRHARTIPNNGKIKITFPSELDITNASFNAWSGINGDHSLAIDDDTVVITRDGTGTNTTYGSRSITLDGIKHPDDEIDVVIEIETTQSDDTSIDEGVQAYTLGTSLDPDETWQWSTYAGDNRRSNRSLVAGPVYGTVVRTIDVGGSVSSLLLGKHDEDVVLRHGGRVTKFNAGGELDWSYTMPDNTHLVCNGAIASDQTLYVTTCDTVRYRAYGIDKDGNSKWSYIGESDDYGGFTPVALWGGSAGYMLYKVQGGYFEVHPLSTGIRATHYADVVWGGYKTGFALYGNTAYFNMNGNVVKSIDIDGTVRWNNTTSYTAGDISANHMALSQDGSRAYLGSQAGKFYSIDAATGAKLWEFDTVSNSPLMVAPAVADTGEVYIVDNNGVMYALRDDGSSPTLLWSYETGATDFNYWRGGNSIVLSAPNGMVYTQSRAHALYAVDNSGGLKWKYAGGTRNHIGGLPIDTSGKLHALVGNNIVHIAEWTLQAYTGSAVQQSPSYTKPGNEIAITAESSMLKRDPLVEEDNIIQAVMPNGDKVKLAYAGQNGSNSVWKGTYKIPEGTATGTYTATIEASAWKMETDIPVNFNNPIEGSENTGITSTFEFRVDNSTPNKKAGLNGKTFEVSTVEGEDYGGNKTIRTDRRKPTIRFLRTIDEVSGMDYYQIRLTNTDSLGRKQGGDYAWIDNIPDQPATNKERMRYREGFDIKYRGDTIVIEQTNGHEYELAEGTYFLRIRAYDKSGNYRATDEIRLIVNDEYDEAYKKAREQGIDPSTLTQSGQSTPNAVLALDRIGTIPAGSYRVFYYTAQNVLFTGRVTGENLQSSEVQILNNGQEIARQKTTDGSYTILTRLSAGSHNIDIKVVNAANPESIRVLNLVIDPTRQSFPPHLR